MSKNMKPENQEAFPIPDNVTAKYNSDGQQIGVHAGISLRDYFAAKAMQGIMVGDLPASHYPETVAKWAFSIADAMLIERSKDHE